MCGRYLLSDPNASWDKFGLEVRPDFYQPRFNIAPTQDAPVLLWNEGLRLRLFRWGLIPSWAQDERVGSKMINARSETIFEKPSFRQSILRQRCLVPASGYYEWRGKQPFHIAPKSGEPLSFAGVWDSFQSTKGQVLSFSILTEAVHPSLASLHHRQPVIIDEKDRLTWLDPAKRNKFSIDKFLIGARNHNLAFAPANTRVGSVSFEGEACLTPSDTQLSLFY